MKEKLIDTALARGIQLKVIDHTRPLEEQGRLEAILHKIRLPGITAGVSLELECIVRPRTLATLGFM